MSISTCGLCDRCSFSSNGKCKLLINSKRLKHATLKDDRYFVSGSTDGKIRIWNIPQKRVVSWASSPDKSVITAVGFTPDGKTVCAGSTNGQLFLYDTEKLKYKSKMVLKRRHAKRGRKITGIEIMPRTTEPIVLVTSNDSEVRLIHVGDKYVLHRYIGAENKSSQIKAAPRYTFNSSTAYMITILT